MAEDMGARRTGNRLHAVAGLPGLELLEADFGGRPFGRHAHDAFAIGAIDAGVGGYDCRGGRHALPRHTLSLMNPDEPHTGYAVSDRLRYKMLYVREDVVPACFDVGAVRGFRELTPVDDGRVIARRLAGLHAVLTGPAHPGWRLALDAAVLDLLAEAFSRYGGLRARPAGRETGAVRATRDHILDAATRAATEAEDDAPEISLNALAARVGLHPHYLLRCFTAQVGISPYAFWLARRIEAAKTLMTGGLTPLDVAHRLGFHDQAHFIRTFRRVTGVTPGAFVVHGR